MIHLNCIQYEDIGRQNEYSITAMYNEKASSVSRQNSGDDLAGFGVTGTGVTSECEGCGAAQSAEAFACGACGQYLGGGN